MSETFETRIHVLAGDLPAEFVAQVDAEFGESHGPEIEIPDILVEVEFGPGFDEPANLSGHPDSWTPAGGEAPEILNVTIVDGGFEILASLSKVQQADLVHLAEEEQASWVDDGGW